MQKKIIMIFSILIILILMGGCTSADGTKIVQAITKSTQWKSVEINQEMSASLNYENLNSSSFMREEANDFCNLVNNSKVNLTSKVDLKNNKASGSYLFDFNMIKLSDTVYTDKEKIWVKEQPEFGDYYDEKVIFMIPTNNRYIEIDLKQLFPNAKSKFNATTQERLKNLTLKFIKDYVTEYKNTFKNITNKGTVTVKTETGVKNINNIEIALNDEETYKLIKYTLDNFADNTTVDSYCMDVLSTYIESINSSKIEDFNAKDMEDGAKNELESVKQYIKDNSDEIVKEILAGIKIDSKGIVFNIGIDEEGNLYNIDLSVKFCVENIDSDSGKLDVGINVKTQFNNINSTTVEIPKFNKRNTMSFKNYVVTHDELRDSEIGDLLGVRPKPIEPIIEPEPIIQDDRAIIHFVTGSSFVYTSQNYYQDGNLKIAPYIEGDTAMVQGRYLGENLNYQVDYDEKNKTLIYKELSDNTIIKVKLGSTTAYVNDKKVEMPTVPIMLGGEVIVPLRFIAENLGATVSTNDTYYGQIYITVDKPKK